MIRGVSTNRIRALASQLAHIGRGAGLDDKKRTPWWESNLLLLLVGAVLTHFLAPGIQDSLETIKWQRQQEVDQERQTLDAMRRFLTDFADLHARSGQMDTLSRSAIMPHLNQIRPMIYQTKFDQMMLDWYSQSARVSGQLMLFKQNGEIKEAFQRYCEAASESLISYREAVLLRNATALRERRGIYSDRVNNLYESVLNLSHEEVQSAQKRFLDQLSKRSKSSWLPSLP